MNQNYVLAEYLQKCSSIPESERVRLSTAVSKYPLPIQCGADALQLDGGSQEAAKCIQQYFDNKGSKIPFSRSFHRQFSKRGRDLETTAASEQPSEQLKKTFPESPQRNADDTPCESHLPPTTRRNRLDIRQYLVRSSRSAIPRARGFKILVDHRERTSGSHSTLRQYFQSQTVVDLEDAQLPCGDFMFVDKTTGSVYPAIIERKTFEDLSSSLVQPRLAEQKRLMKALDFPYNFILLEGSMYLQNLQSDELKRIHSALITGTLVDGFVVCHCQTKLDTFDALLAIGDFLSENTLPSRGDIHSLMQSISEVKQHFAIKMTLPSMLANLRGCTGETGCAIAWRFGSPLNMHTSVALMNSDPSSEHQFVSFVQKLKKRRKESAELCLQLIQLFGANEYFS